MNIFTRKGLFKKLIIIIIAITLFSAIIPPNVTYAADPGGKLLKPIVDLLLAAGDFFMDLMHSIVYKFETALIRVDMDPEIWQLIRIGFNVILAIGAIVALGAVAVALGATILTALGATLTAGSIITATAGTIITTAIGGGVLAGMYVNSNYFDNELVLPMYKISPEEIFSGEINWLNINFFKDEEERITDEDINPYEQQINNRTLVDIINEYNNIEMQLFIDKYKDDGEDITFMKSSDIEDANVHINRLLKKNGYIGDYISCPLNKKNETQEIEWQTSSRKKYIATIVTEVDDHNTFFEYVCTFDIKEKDGISVLSRPITITYYDDGIRDLEALKIDDIEENVRETVKIKFENIFKTYGYKDNINVLQNDFWSDQEYQAGYEINKEIKWSNDLYGYVANLAKYEEYSSDFETMTYRIDSLKKGEYIGIERTTLASDLKPIIAKWYYAVRNFVLVAMMVILLYIGIRIIFSGVSSEKAKYKNMLMDWLVAICLVFVMHYIMSFAMNLVDGIIEIFSSVNDKNDFVVVYDYDDKLETALKNGGIIVDPIYDGATDTISWKVDNIMGMARIQAAQNRSATYLYFGYVIAYLVLVCQTVFFFATYIKRAIYLTFFTIIAPLVAMTYPIDKLHDGKAQAFDMWLKEYIFNLMIQPMHLLLYTVLISSAFNLASTNILYTLVAIGFMMPAEKFVRKMFGFDKAQTPGFLGGAAGAALAMTAANKLFHRRPSKGGGNKLEDNEKTDKEDKIKLTAKDNGKPTILSQPGGGNTASSNNGVNPQRGPRTSPPNNPPVNTSGGGQAQNRSTSGQAPNRSSTGGPSNRTRRGANTGPKESLESFKQRLRTFGKGLKGAAKTYAKQKFKRLGKNLATGKPIRALARLAGGLAVGAGGLLTGGMFGVASGELKNVTGYAATLGAAGYAIGSRDIGQDSDISQAYKSYEREQFDSEDEYREYLLDQQWKQKYNDDKYVEQVATYMKCDKDTARAYMEEYREFIDKGVDDSGDFAAAIKCVAQEGWDREAAIVAAKQLKELGGDPAKMGREAREDVEYKYNNIFRNEIGQNQGETDDQYTARINREIDEALKSVSTFASIKRGNTKV